MASCCCSVTNLGLHRRRSASSSTRRATNLSGCAGTPTRVGHPFWLGRNVFADLRGLHGDKAVWKLLESGSYPVVEVVVPGLVPIDVDTWEDYEALLARDAEESQGVSS